MNHLSRIAQTGGKWIDLIVGARPNFMKIAPILKAMRERSGHQASLGWRLVHTGQHYDMSMSGSFFEQLGLPAPDINLEVGSGSAAEQTAAILTRYEALLLARGLPACCLVVGDVTSTMACAITARKLGVPVAHVEAGIRSGDWTMPEEVNRVVTDSITNWFFTTSAFANSNLKKAGIEDGRIFFVGNTMIDTLLANIKRLRKPGFFEELGLEEYRYIVATLHRPANVDSEQLLARTVSAIGEGVAGLPVVFPVHPRTYRNLANIGEFPANVHFVDPQPYLEFNWLVKHATGVVTDSGGITEETTVLGVPCLTLRDNTERPETVELGTNELIGSNPEKVAAAMAKIISGTWKRGTIPPMWDGRAGERIVSRLCNLLDVGV